MCAERRFLVRCFVAVLTVGLVVGVADLVLCRGVGGACQVQRVALRDALALATAGISGLLIRVPD